MTILTYFILFNFENKLFSRAHF